MPGLLEEKIEIELPLNMDEVRTKIHDYKASRKQNRENVPPVDIKFKLNKSNVSFEGYWLYRTGVKSHLPYQIYGEINDYLDHTVLKAHLVVPKQRIIFWVVFIIYMLFAMYISISRESYILLYFAIGLVIVAVITGHIWWRNHMFRVSDYLKSIFEKQLSETTTSI